MGKARRAKGTGSIFCKPNGRYGYRFTDPAGKIRSQGLFAEDGKPITNKEAAIEAVKKIVPSIQEAARLTSKLEYLTKAAELKNLISPIHISVADMWTAYENSPYRPDSSSATMDFYHDAVLPFQKWLGLFHSEIKEIRDVTEELASEYAVYFWKSGVSERTYNGRITTLKLIFKVLLKGENPFSAIHRKVARPQTRNAFSTEQLKAIAQTMDDPGYYMLHKTEMRLMLLIMLYTGCRGEDAALMKWSYVDMECRTITYIPLKTGRKRPIPVMVPIADCLYSALMSHEHKESDYVLPAVAERYQRNPAGISLDITKLLEASGIQTKIRDPQLRRQRPIVKFSMHSFRHTFCTLAINAGIPIATIQDIVGHSTATMTAHYSHIAMSSKQKAIQTIPDIMLKDAPDTASSIAENLPKLTSAQLTTAGQWLDKKLSSKEKKEFMGILA